MGFLLLALEYFLILHPFMVKKQAAIGFIFITLLIDVIGWGLIIPVMPQLISGLKHITVNQASREGDCYFLFTLLCNSSALPYSVI